MSPLLGLLQDATHTGAGELYEIDLERAPDGMIWGEENCVFLLVNLEERDKFRGMKGLVPDGAPEELCELVWVWLEDQMSTNSPLTPTTVINTESIFH